MFYFPNNINYKGYKMSVLLWAALPLFLASPYLTNAVKRCALLKALFRENATVKNNYFTVDPAQLEWLDKEQLKQMTAQLEGLGFQFIFDLCAQQIRANNSAPSTHTAANNPFASSTHAPPIPDPVVTKLPFLAPQEVNTFGRIFIHPQHGIAANILASRAELKQLDGSTLVTMMPPQISMISLFGEDENYWSFGTTNHEPYAFGELQSHPRALYVRRVKASARELLEIHLEKLPKLEAKIPERRVKFTKGESYMKFEELAGARLRATYARKNAFQATLQLATFKFRRHDQNLGNFA